MLSDVLSWVNGNGWLIAEWAGLWVVLLVATVVAVRYFLISIPPDYFAKDHRPLADLQKTHPVVRYSVLVAKNLTGGILLVFGLVMLITPGPGWFALLLGLSMVDIPGKRAAERWILSRPMILHLVNTLRSRAGKPPLLLTPAQSRR